MKTIRIFSSAKKDLKALDKEAARKILTEILPDIEANPMAGDLLKGEFKGLRSFHLIHKATHY